jgi:hypothetical protein
VTADHRSAHPSIPGLPWWGAVLLAATFTATGFAFDAGSGNKELGSVFAALYFIGCVVAVLAVRQAGIFTAVIQPPLLLFISVPAAYFLFTGGEITGIKDVLINCGYPLIERFPLMFFASAATLLIGMGRWYHGMSMRKAAPPSTSADTTKSSFASAVTSKLSSLLSREPHDDEAEIDPPPRRRRTAESSSRKPTKRTPPSRSRHARPPETEIIQPVADRPRRTRTSAGRPSEQPPAEPRRRPRSSSTPRRSVPPPSERRAGYERPEPRRRPDDYQPREPQGTNGNGTHHPISRVRYRGADGTDNDPEYRPKRRTPRDRDVEKWEYDI